MKTPGITVKPIIMADGGHEVNEVFFDNVKVPVDNLVGKENEGWTCAKFLLANERLGIAAVPQSKRGVEALKDIARAEQDNGRPLIENQSFAEKIADLEIQVTALEYTELRVLSTMAHGGQPGPEVSGLKIRGSEIQQRITELTMEAVGEYSAPYLPGLLWQGTNEEPVGPDYAHLAAPRYFNTRKTTIYGGSNEIQKGIIRKMVLGALRMDLALKARTQGVRRRSACLRARRTCRRRRSEKTFSGKHYDRDDHIVWQQALGKKGWLAYTWPKKYGGPGWDVTQRFLFENVLAEEGAPRILPFGPKMVGPVIYTFGTDEQKERFLPGIRSSEVSWCQGYSEPGAGSDLASLRTARRVPDSRATTTS